MCVCVHEQLQQRRQRGGCAQCRLLPRRRGVARPLVSPVKSATVTILARYSTAFSFDLVETLASGGLADVVQHRQGNVIGTF